MSYVYCLPFTTLFFIANGEKYTIEVRSLILTSTLEGSWIPDLPIWQPGVQQISTPARTRVLTRVTRSGLPK